MKLITPIYFLVAFICQTFNALAQYAEPPVPIPITANWTLEKNQAYASYGSAVANAGDVNGDGYSDVLVAAPDYDHGETNEGAVFLYYGSVAGLNATPGWWKEGNQAEAYFGYSISTAGDVNNDGYDDVVIGCPNYDGGQNNEGKVFLYLGSPAGLSNTAAWTFESNQAEALIGIEVSNAGDITGDNYDDILVGSTVYDSEDAEANAGIILLFEGNADDLNDSASWSHHEYYCCSGFGRVLSSAGDVNGDGYDDILAGAKYWGWDAPGTVFAYYGSASGLPDTHSWSEANGEEEFMGTALTSGDLNGDGYSDVILSGPGNADVGGLDVYVYYGGPAGLAGYDWAIGTDADPWESDNLGASLATADVNNDGYDDLIIGSDYYDKGQTNEGVIFMYSGGPAGVPGTTSWVAQSNQVEAHLGAAVSSAGDVNGDGYDDFIGGAPDFDNGQTDEGQARIYLGNAGCVDPPDVALNFIEPVCHLDGIITLTQGTPAGGTYTGTGIIGTAQFDPSLAGVGTHSITYTFIAAGGCSASASDDLTVAENPTASLTLGSASLNLCENSPVVLVANNTPGLTYQWYKNGIILPGEIYLAYLAYSTGNYQVQTTNASGCSKMSKKKKVTHTGCREGEFENEELIIYPNPSRGQFSVSINSTEIEAGPMEFRIIDMQGRIVHDSEINAESETINTNFDLTLPAGIYLIQFVQDDLIYSSRIVIE